MTPRGLSAEERAAWRAVAATVAPLDPPRHREEDRAAKRRGGGATEATASREGSVRQPRTLGTCEPPTRTEPRSPRPRLGEAQLDSHWERRLKSGAARPELTLDLHGHTLDAAWHRLMDGMAQARGMGARLLLVVTGKPRPVDPADRGQRRGAIRAKIVDWLAASEHAGAIAAIRPAPRRRGGEGALLIVLRKR